jgi:hypothetical protein
MTALHQLAIEDGLLDMLWRLILVRLNDEIIPEMLEAAPTGLLSTHRRAEKIVPGVGRLTEEGILFASHRALG